MYRANATTAAAVAEKKVVVASCFRPSIFFNRTIGGKRRRKKERRGREGRKGKIFFDNAFRFDRKQKKEEKDRWNPDSYCIESQSLTGKKIETNPSNSIRVGSRGRNNGFSLHTPWKSIFDVQFQTQYQTLRIFTTCVIKGYRILDIPG